MFRHQFPCLMITRHVSQWLSCVSWTATSCTLLMTKSHLCILLILFSAKYLFLTRLVIENRLCLSGKVLTFLPRITFLCSKQAADASTSMTNTLCTASMESSHLRIGLQTTNNSFRMQEEEEGSKKTEMMAVKSIASCTRFTQRKIKLFNFPLTHLTYKNPLFLMSKCMTADCKNRGGSSDQRTGMKGKTHNRDENRDEKWNERSARGEGSQQKHAKAIFCSRVFIHSLCLSSLTFLLITKTLWFASSFKQYDIFVSRLKYICFQSKSNIAVVVIKEAMRQRRLTEQSAVQQNLPSYWSAPGFSSFSLSFSCCFSYSYWLWFFSFLLLCPSSDAGDGAC